MSKYIIELNSVSKEYNSKKIKVLKDLSVKFERGKFYAIMGHSGSGKSTLINIIGLLDDITLGDCIINDINIKNIKENDKADIRKNFIGFIFQNFYLDPYLKAYENIMLPMMLQKDLSKFEKRQIAISLLEKVGLKDRINHFPKELSGGEQQRVAIARALTNNPDIILADEPTGNLDELSEKKIFKILKDLSKMGKCVIVVSHSNEVLKYADVVFNIKDGKLIGN